MYVCLCFSEFPGALSSSNPGCSLFLAQHNIEFTHALSLFFLFCIPVDSAGLVQFSSSFFAAAAVVLRHGILSC